MSDWSHQDRAIEAAREKIRAGCRRFVLQLPTGGGKTRIAAKICKMSAANGRRSMMIVDQDNLVQQTIDSFVEQGINPGVIQQEHELTDYGKVIQIASVHSLKNRLSRIMQTDVFIEDECHYQYETYKTLRANYPSAVYIGLTATPFAKGMAELYDEIIVAAKYDELTEKGVLVPYYWDHPEKAFTEEAARGGGDDISQANQSKVYTQVATQIIPYWQAHASKMKTLAFVPLIADADKLAEDFREQGIDAYAYHSIDAQTLMKKAKDRDALHRFKRGELQVLVTVGKAIKGFDEPTIECLLIARITKSKSLHFQMIGRGIRSAPGKQRCFIIDLVGNIRRNGTTDDIDREEAELDDGTKGAASDRPDKDPQFILCDCGVQIPPRSKFCPACGSEVTRESRLLEGDFKMVSGKKDESETDKQDLEYRKRRAFYLGALGHATLKGYKLGFAKGLYKEKFGEWPKYEWQKMEPITPNIEVKNYIKYRQIRNAKSKQKQQQEEARA